MGLPNWKSKADIGIVAILNLVTVLGATGTLLTNLLTDALTITKKQGLNDQLEGIRKSIRLQMSCNQTLSGTPCGSTFLFQARNDPYFIKKDS